MPPEKEQAVLVQQTTQKKESNKKKSKDKISCFMIQRNSYKVIEDWNYP